MGSVPPAQAMIDMIEGDIAIVGMGCRLPGGIHDPEGLWKKLAGTSDGWSQIPKNRFNPQGYHHPSPAKHGSFNSGGGYFLEEDLTLFDAPFFNVTANEANALDPQQRILLECTYEALENAGWPVETLSGTSTGVFMGSSASDYAIHMLRDTQSTPMFHGTGCAESMMANRVSYTFDLKGPSVTSDTACSSAMSSLHLACQSLRAGDSSQAIVGSCHLNVTPDSFISLSKSRLLSPEGRSYAFDHRATSGYGRGEGAAVIILKSLHKAIADGDTVRAVIKASGMNQDGKTAGITMPNGKAQAELIRFVYNRYGLNPLDTDYVEAHGTGTAVGDPIEAAALASVFAPNRSSEKPLYIGSLKSQVGHLEGASGVASVVKTVLMLEKGVFLPNANFEKPNPSIPLGEWNFKVATTETAWLPPGGRPRTASVNSFGFGGSNVHVVLSQGLNSIQPNAMTNLAINDNNGINGVNGRSAKPASLSRRVFVMTAKDEISLQTYADRLAFYLEDAAETTNPGFEASLAYTLGLRRSCFPWRLAISATTKQDLARTLQKERPKAVRAMRVPILNFVFTGQGAQWLGMGRELMQEYPIFASAMQRADDCLPRMGAKWSLIDELYDDTTTSRLAEAVVSQTACAAIQISLTVLLKSWGIRPTAVMGHSSGEIAAAFAAGVLSLEDAMLLAYHRGVVSMSLKSDYPHLQGAMIAIGAGEEDAAKLLHDLTLGRAVIACINSPSSVTISGDDSAISEVQSKAEERGLFNRRLHVDMAYHSHHMELVANMYSKAIRGAKPSHTDVEFYSSLTGKQEESSSLDSSYWTSNLVSSVKFTQALETLYSSRMANTDPQDHIMIEIGPHGALEGPVKEILGKVEGQSRKVHYLPSLVRKKDGVAQMQRLASKLFMRGHHVDLAAVNQMSQENCRVLTDLPTYSWKHTQQYWHASRIAQNHQLRSFGRNDILGTMSDESNELEPTWRCVLDPDDVPWLRHHKVQGQTVFPIAGYLAMTVEAARQKAKMRGIDFDQFLNAEYRLREMVTSRALVIEESAETEIMTTLRPYNQSTRGSSDTWDEIRIFSWTSGRNWIEHLRALVSVNKNEESDSSEGVRKLSVTKQHFLEMATSQERACTKDVDWPQFVQMFSKIGIDYGPTFQNISNVRASENRSVTSLHVSDTATIMPLGHEIPYIIHPATLDMCCQGIFPAFTNGLPSLTQTYMPTFIKEMVINHDISNGFGDQLTGYFSTEGHASSTGAISGSGFVVDASKPGKLPAVRVQGLILTPLSNDDTSSLIKEPNELCSKVIWEPTIDLLKQNQFQKLLGEEQIPEGEKARVRVHEQGSFYYFQKALAVLNEEETNRFQSHHQQFFRYMKGRVAAAEEGGLSLQTPEWLNADQSSREEFLCKLRNHDNAGELICNMGEAIPRILRQQIDPLSIMLENDLLGRWYQNNISLEVGYAQTANLINKVAHQNPFLNILEVGAGTGGITVPTLKALGGYDGKKARFEKYTFTDISTGFFENAKKKLEPWESLITYGRLDIEKDPAEQGFPSEEYDLIIAANVLHATTNIERTLKNTAKMLKPGGKLLLVELTTQLLHHFMFACLPGWWLSEESFRPEGPIMKQETWNEVLKASGFSGIDLNAQDFPGEPEQSGSLMISTKLAQAPIDPPDIVIVCDSPPKGLNLTQLQESLKARTGGKVVVAPLAEADLDQKWCIVLEELNRPILVNITTNEFKKVQSLISAVRGVLWVCQDSTLQSGTPDTSMIFGLARVVRNETGVKMNILDLDRHQTSDGIGAASTIAEVFDRTLVSNASAVKGETELVQRQGLVKIPRVLIDRTVNQSLDRNLNQAKPQPQPLLQKDRPLKMRITSPGLLDSICFEDDAIARTQLQDDQVEICVKATSLNFKDILIAMGQVPYENPGLECGGVIVGTGKKVLHLSSGDRVCASVSGSFANYVRCPASDVGKIPDSMSFAEGASVPAIYATAYYGLIELARLCEGETVLIHAAAGGVGQAAIMIAQMVGAKIFATVGSDEKKAHIAKTYHIPEDQIFFSRDTSFKEHVMRTTHKEGVDVVLNSLTGDLLHASWECLTSFGRFIEIGKRDLQLNSKLEMDVWLRNTTFTAVDLGALREKKPKLFRKMLTEVLSLYQSGKLKPVTPLTLFSFSQIQEAFRFMQSGKHIGKIVLEVREGDKVMATFPKNKGGKLRSDASYVITGGSGGLGRSLSKWMVEQGARNIILASRSGLKNNKARALVDELAEMGAALEVRHCDVANRKEVEELVNECAKFMPPIRGAIHGAMVLKDMLFENSDFAHFTSIIAPKVPGAWNLHHALSKTELDFFLMLGSVSGIVGNRGQAAYACTSAFLNAFAQFRARQGLPAVCLDLGVVEDVGYIAENTEAKVTLTDLYSDMIGGEKTLNVTEKKLHALVQAAITGEVENGHSVLTGIRLRAGDAEQFWEGDPKFSHLRRAVFITQTDKSSKQSEMPVGQLLKQARSAEDVYGIFTESIIRKTSSILMIPLGDIVPSMSIAEYGLDSLVAVEIRNWMARDLGATLALLELLTSPSIEQLAQNVAKKSALVDQKMLEVAETK